MTTCPLQPANHPAVDIARLLDTSRNREAGHSQNHALFAPVGTYQPLVPATPASVVGPDFEAALERQFATYHECRCELHAVAAQGPHVFTERTDHVTLHAGDRKVASRVCAVFELDDAGLIVSWREYWDTGDVMRQMGFTAEQLAAAM